MSSQPSPGSARRRGSVMIIVLWVCLGLVALAVYFADQMSAELRAADNQVMETEARQAALAGTRYAAFVLSQFGLNGTVPHPDDYRADALAVGEAAFWFLGRDPDQRPGDEPVFRLVDEASKLNLNSAPRSMLELLPGITPELVDAIVAWRSRSQSGGGDSTYGLLDPPRLNKGAPFETVDELRLVYGASLDVLLGEDVNRNGILDENENDGDQSAPRDNADGLVQPGLLEYVTVYSREPNTRPDGSRRLNVATAQSRQSPAFLQVLGRLGGGRAQEIVRALGSQELRSPAELMVEGRFTAEEWAQIRDEVTTSSGSTVTGRINVNTADEVVLGCIPGIGPENAPALVAYRLANPDAVRGSFAWLAQVLSRGSITRAGPYITDRSYQFTADVVAVARGGRGYARTRTVFDASRSTPRIVYHQDLAASGWALGPSARQLLRETRNRL